MPIKSLYPYSNRGTNVISRICRLGYKAKPPPYKQQGVARKRKRSFELGYLDMQIGYAGIGYVISKRDKEEIARYRVIA